MQTINLKYYKRNIKFMSHKYVKFFKEKAVFWLALIFVFFVMLLGFLAKIYL